MLEAMREVCPEARFYQASSSEMFGKVREVPQTETTPFYPRSPYGVAKVYGHFITVNYRESYDLHATSGILFNHESPRRGLRVRHAQDHLARRGDQARAWPSELRLGNLDAERDWGYAKDYVEAMWLMLQQDEPERLRDRHRRGPFGPRCVRDRLRPRRPRRAEHSSCSTPRFLRPAEVDHLIGDAARPSELGLGAAHDFDELIRLMVDTDYRALTG